MGEVIVTLIIAATAAAVSLLVTRVFRGWAVSSSRVRTAKVVATIGMLFGAAGMFFSLAGPFANQIAELIFLASALQFGVFALFFWQLIGDAEAVEARRMIANDL
ncbi:MAG: hypothetical protein QNI99_08220 [Woeseiaceae bacterium]|nr:hypothetical protein [Woeseiaceae bacterium]